MSNCIVRRMLGFLYYVTYKESNKTNVWLASKRLIQKSLNLDNSCVKLRAAKFVLTNLEYSQSIEIDDTFLTFPTRHQLNSEYMHAIGDKVFEQLFKVKTTEEIENIMKAILPMLCSSIEIYAWKLRYNTTKSRLYIPQFHKHIFPWSKHVRNFYDADKWMVPDAIQ